MKLTLIALLLTGCSPCLGQTVPTAPSAQTTSAAPPAVQLPSGPPLTLQDAEKLALKNNPRIAVERLLALAQGQVTREARAAQLPTVNADLTAVGSHNGSRITAGSLNNPIVYQRAAGGVTLSQLVTDFGRTHNLVGSADLRAKAQASVADATTADITFAVDEAYYRALGSQTVLQVAAQTVAERQTTADQISALASAGLRSTLDLSFANVSLAQAKLMLLDAQNQIQEAMGSLNALLGSESSPNFSLVEDTTASSPPPDDPEPLVAAALNSRPDLRALVQASDAARRFTAAERDLKRPTISALGSAGGSPVRADQITTAWYGAAGVNVRIPVFNGFLFSARAHEAEFRARAADQQVKDLREAIARDVRVTTLQAQSNFQRIAVAQQLLSQANSALDLAQTRYNLGLSSIVELSQAQLAQTEALIDVANARYAYKGSLAAIRFQTAQ